MSEEKPIGSVAKAGGKYIFYSTLFWIAASLLIGLLAFIVVHNRQSAPVHEIIPAATESLTSELVGPETDFNNLSQYYYIECVLDNKLEQMVIRKDNTMPLVGGFIRTYAVMERRVGKKWGTIFSSAKISAVQQLGAYGVADNPQPIFTYFYYDLQWSWTPQTGWVKAPAE